MIRRYFSRCRLASASLALSLVTAPALAQGDAPERLLHALLADTPAAAAALRATLFDGPPAPDDIAGRAEALIGRPDRLRPAVDPLRRQAAAEAIAAAAVAATRALPVLRVDRRPDAPLPAGARRFDLRAAEDEGRLHLPLPPGHWRILLLGAAEATHPFGVALLVNGRQRQVAGTPPAHRAGAALGLGPAGGDAPAVQGAGTGALLLLQAEADDDGVRILLQTEGAASAVTAAIAEPAAGPSALAPGAAARRLLRPAPAALRQVRARIARAVTGSTA